jgi:hypothetical protein
MKNVNRRGAMHFRVLLILPLILITFFSSSVSCLAGKNDPKLIYVLFDLSGSVKPERRESYARWFNSILDREDAIKNDGDRIVVEAIRDRSAVQATYLVNQAFPDYSPFTDNKLRHKAEFNKIREEMKKDVKALLTEQKGSKTTEIISALIPAQQIFESYPEYGRKILLIMSDMLEESPNYNFDRRPPDERKTKKIIALEKKKNRLPQLTGITVYVAGAGGRSTEQMRKVKNFWLEYFKACGARLEPHNYGAGLARFEE